jgi:predicted amidophosphoribosyltransferase
MGGVSWLAQCALDFLIDERCHTCGNTGVSRSHEEASALSAPVVVFSAPGFRLTTRILCDACAGAIKPWSGEVTLPKPDALARVYPAYMTDERLLAMIHLLKFSRRERIAPWLARAMAAQLPDFSLQAEEKRVVIPVPMDRRSRMRRGFNQAERIARGLAERWNLPLDTRALTKVRPTRSQSTLGREERLTNLDGAFSADPSRVRGVNVILVRRVRRVPRRRPGRRLSVSSILTRTSGRNNIDNVVHRYPYMPDLPHALCSS